MAGADRPLILLCNDDGYHCEGIQILLQRLRPLGKTIIVAPDRERSASSLALTLRRPLRLHRIKADVWSTDGTPADSVYFALQKVLPRRPDLLISGMNPGPNLGQADVHYSGTVAGALQGTFCGIPSMAVSLLADSFGCYPFGPVAGIVRRIAEKILAGGLPEGVTLNVNIPPPPLRGVRITRLGRKFYNPEVIEKKDPRGLAYYWIGTGKPTVEGSPDTDLRATDRGYLSITPLQADLTCGPAFRRVSFARLWKGVLSD